jgi:hypothetical protein
LQLREEKI